MKVKFKVTSGLLLMSDDDETANYIDSREPGSVINAEILDDNFGDKNQKRKQRTLTQNACLYKYIAELAEKMNDAGYDVRQTINVNVDFTPDTVKKYMFNPVMRAMYPDKISTTKLDTKEISLVYENLNRMTSEKFGISVFWPDRFNY